MIDGILKNEILQYEKLAIDLKRREVTIDKQSINLSAKEFDLLYFLANHPGWVFTYEELYQSIWNQEPVNYKNSVMCCISQIRKKIEVNPKNPKYIHTVRYIGYKFQLLPEE